MRLVPANMTFDYTNWKGHTGSRCVEARELRYGTSEWYPQPCWLLQGIDLDKNAPPGVSPGPNDQHHPWVGVP